MKYHQYYGDLIWTYHAIDRLKQRGLSQQDAWESFKHPDVKRLVNNGATEYQKQIDNRRVSIITKQNERREWVVISCWVDPPLPGSPDARGQEMYRKYQKASFWGKLWLTLLKQIGM